MSIKRFILKPLVASILGKSISSNTSATPPAPACSITLTGDIASAVGGTAMTIAGQTASYTLPAASSPYIVSTPEANLFSPPTVGTKLVEVKLEQTGDAQPSAALSGASYFLNILLFGGRYYVALLNQGTFTPVALAGYSTGNISSSSKIAIGLAAGGTPVVFVDGAPITLFDAATETTPVDMTGFFSGGAALAALDQSGFSSGSGSVEFVTAGANFEAHYVGSGLLDWCDTDTVPRFNPDSLVSVGGDIFYSSAFAAEDTLYQDAGLTTVAGTAGDPIGGIKNLSSTGTLALSQSTTADKFVVHVLEGVTRARRTTTSTAKMLSDGVFDMDAGMVLSIKFYLSSSQSPTLFGGNNNHLRVTRTSIGNLQIRAGGSTLRDIPGVLPGTQVSYRVTLAFGAGLCDVYVNGEVVDSFATQTSTTVFDAVVIGATSVTGASIHDLYLEDVLLANTDGRLSAAAVSQINAFMEGLAA